MLIPHTSPLCGNENPHKIRLFWPFSLHFCRQHGIMIMFKYLLVDVKPLLVFQHICKGFLLSVYRTYFLIWGVVTPLSVHQLPVPSFSEAKRNAAKS